MAVITDVCTSWWSMTWLSVLCTGKKTKADGFNKKPNGTTSKYDTSLLHVFVLCSVTKQQIKCRHSMSELKPAKKNVQFSCNFPSMVARTGLVPPDCPFSQKCKSGASSAATSLLHKN